MLREALRASQQASSDERLLDFSQGGKVQIHLGNGAGDQFTRDAKPLLTRSRSGPIVEAIVSVLGAATPEIFEN